MLNGWAESIRTRLAYRADRFVRLHGALQILILAAVTTGIVFAFAAVLALTGGAPDAQTPWEHLWWSLGRFSDGGTMYPDHGVRLRLLAIAVTWTGVFLVQFMTGAVTAKLTDRLDQVRAGRSPVLARDHVLILGFDAKAPLIARELARSHQRKLLVVLADRPVKEMDAQLAAAGRIPGNRLRIETRAGNPQDELDLLRVSADRAGAIIIIPPEQLDDRSASRWMFAALLAVRRVAGPTFSGHVLVESRHSGREHVLRAAADPPVFQSDASPLRLIPIASDDIVSRILAQSVRQVGVYFVLRELLSFRGTELYFEPVPRVLAGKRFGEIHARVQEGIAVGFRPKGGEPVINPPDAARVQGGDDLIVLQCEQGRYELSRSPTLPEPETWQPHGADTEEDPPMSVFILGDNRALPEFTHELASTLPTGSRICVINDLEPDAARSPCVEDGVELRFECANPVEVARNPPEALLQANAVVILGAGAENDLEADAAALETLVCLRHAERERGIRLQRLVTELRNLGSAMHVAGTQDDFLVSAEILGLLMTQLALNPDLEPVLYKDLLDPGGNDVVLRPRRLYGGEAPVTFAEVMCSARLRGEVAIGLFRPSMTESAPDFRRLLEGRAEHDEISPAILVPPRDMAVPDDAMVVVFAKP